MVNKVFLIGKVTKIPVLTYWEKDKKPLAVLKFEIETNGNKNGVTDIHEITAFADEAERVAVIPIAEGDFLVIDGRLKSKIKNNQRVHEIYARSVEKMEVSK